MPIFMLPGARCNASHVACPQDTSAGLWYGIFLTGWATFCRNSAYRNSPLTTLKLGEIDFTVGNSLQNSQLPPPMCSIRNTFTGHFWDCVSLCTFPQISSYIAKYQQLLQSMLGTGLHTMESAGRTGEGVAGARRFSVHYVLFS